MVLGWRCRLASGSGRKALRRGRIRASCLALSARLLLWAKSAATRSDSVLQLAALGSPSAPGDRSFACPGVENWPKLGLRNLALFERYCYSELVINRFSETPPGPGLGVRLALVNPDALPDHGLLELVHAHARQAAFQQAEYARWKKVIETGKISID